MKKLFLGLLAGCAFALFCTSCSDDDETSGKLGPAVELTDGKVEFNTLTFTIVPQRAVACAYTFFKKGEALPSAEWILASGRQVSADTPTTVSIDEGLDANAAYIVAAAVKSSDGLLASNTIELTTGEEKIQPEVELTDAEAEADKLTFKIVPQRAVACAYTVSKKGEAQLSAEEILASGTQVAFDAPTSVTIDEGIEPNTTYVIAAAVKSTDEVFAMHSLELTTDAEETATDLGASANCYIVSEQGLYSFEPKKVSGEAIANIASADWIWSTKTAGSSEQALVSDIAYRNGKIYFNASGKRGNVVLAAFDAVGKIVWSWHIWCTDQPQTMTHENGSVFLDRFLGATSTQPGSIESFGLFYQWGRKDPFFGGTELEQYEKYSEPPFPVANANTIMNPDFGLKWECIERGADIARSIAEPTHHFCTVNHDWLTVHDETLWGPAKTDYDPCPAGYRVPETEELSDLLSLSENDYDFSNFGVTYSYKGQSAWWPGAGNRDPYGFLTIVGYSFIWTATVQEPVDNNDGTLVYFTDRLLINDFGNMIIPGNRAFAQSIRCVAE